MSGKTLGVYLRDHHAGSTAGLALARRAAGSNRGNTYGAELESIVVEIEADQRSLERVMEAAGVEPSRLKDWSMLVAERLGRLKPNGTWISYSPLSRLFEIEALIMAVSGKRSLWQAVEASDFDPPAGIDLAHLVERADSQRDRLEQLRSRAATEALRSS